MAKKKFSKSNLLWFVRTRSYTPVSDLRRRFRLEDDDVTVLGEATGHMYIGLPDREARMIYELWQEGKVGLELSPRFHARVVEGVYPILTARPTGDGEGQDEVEVMEATDSDPADGSADRLLEG